MNIIGPNFDRYWSELIDGVDQDPYAKDPSVVRADRLVTPIAAEAIKLTQADEPLPLRDRDPLRKPRKH